MARPLMPRRFWTVAEDERLRREYPELSTAVLAGLMRRTRTSLYARAKNLGLVKSDAFHASVDAYRFRRGQGGGVAFRFPKGHAPANKGLRRPGFGPGRMKDTQFKPGVPSHRYMPIGSTRLIEGYVYRKVSDTPNVAYTVNWKPEHHLIWTRRRGPIPAGHALRFKNGNRLDVRLGNLELVTRRALMLRNTVHNLPKPLAQAVQLLGALTRQIRKREGHAQQD